MRILTFSTFSPVVILKCLNVWHSLRWKLHFLTCISLIMRRDINLFSYSYFILIFSVNCLFLALTHFFYPLSLLFCKSSLHANEINLWLCIINISSIFSIWFSLEHFPIQLLKMYVVNFILFSILASKFESFFKKAFWTSLVA